MTTLARVDGVSEHTLARLIKWGALLLVVLVGVFALVYYRGQHVDTGPSLADREVSSAEQAVKDAPQNVQTRLRLAATYQAVGRIEDATVQYDEVLRAVPGNRTALLGKGKILMNSGDLAGATAAFTTIATDASKQEFAGADPDLAAAHYYLGSMAGTQGKYDAAVKELTASLAINRTDADTLYLLGQMQGKNGDEKAAVTSYQQALAFVPTGWCEPYQAMATSYGALGNKDFAAYATAMTSFCLQRPDEATEQLTALTGSTAKVEAFLGLGLVAETESQRDAAVGYYQQALKANPGNSTAITALARLNGNATSTTTGGAAQPESQAKAK